MSTGRSKFTPAIFICLIIFTLFAVTSVAKGTIPVIHKKTKNNKALATKQAKVFLPLLKTAKAGCDDINWATWGSFTGSSATGTVQNSDGSPVNVTMTSNFDFGSTPGIYNHAKFDSYPSPVPDATVPQTTWSKGAGGTTTMCFSKTVSNPVLLIASLGNSAGLSAKLDFSLPYVVLFDGGNMVYNSNTSLTGTEGYAIIMFPGDFTCVTINSTTEEFYTNITWGLRPPPFPININETSNSCNKVTLTAGGGVTYLWNGGDTPNSATNTFHTSGTYIVTVTNAGGCTTSTSATVTVDPDASPPTISQTATTCGTVTLTATGGVTYSWNGGDTPDKPTNTFHQSGTYTVTATSTGGCISTASKVITVNNAPSVTISGNTTGCGSVSLTASGGATYSWDGGDTPDKPTNTFYQSGTYTVTVTNAGGCTASQSKTIVVNPAATTPTISVSSSTCGSVTLTASAGATYLWNGGDTPDKQTNTFHQSGTYTVTVTNAGGCGMSASKTITVNDAPVATITGDASGCGSVVLTAAGGVTYSWDGGDAPDKPSNTFHQSGTYTVIVTNASGCVASQSKTIVVNPAATTPTISVSSSTCGSVTLTASAGATYLWDGGDTPDKQTNTFHQSGTYTVTVANVGGCSLSASKTITVDVLPAFAITGNTTGCGSVTLTAGGGAVSYLWDGGNSPNSAVNTFLSSGTYNVLATFPNNCTATATITVSVNANTAPSISIMASPSTTICAGSPVTFTATPVNGGDSPSLQWYRNNAAVATGTVYTAGDLTNNDVIECHLTSNAACASPAEVASNTLTMVVNAIPTINIDPEITINGDQPVRLNPIITGDIIKYQWTPAEGLDNPNSPTPLVLPENTTTYRLIVTSAAGCEASAGITIKVLKNDVVIPNTFTPNADGVNDTWNIAYLPDYKDAIIDIYSRWGQHVFHSVGYAKPWDGTYNAKPVPAGTYYYVIDLNYNNYKRRSGWVAILR